MTQLCRSGMFPNQLGGYFQEQVYLHLMRSCDALHWTQFDPYYMRLHVRTNQD